MHLDRTLIFRRTARVAAGALAAIAMVGGCGAEPARTDSAGSAADSTRAAVDGAAALNADSSAATTGSRWTARPDGVGPLRVGMTAAQVRAAAGLPAGGADTDSACHYLALPNLPKRLGVMLESGLVTRIDVRDTSVATAEGIRVLSPQDSALAAYAGRVQVQPHKYSRGWSYLVVMPPGDSLHRIVFEGDGNRVTMYRVGRVPAVEYVEGCS